MCGHAGVVVYPVSIMFLWLLSTFQAEVYMDRCTFQAEGNSVPASPQLPALCCQECVSPYSCLKALMSNASEVKKLNK